MYRSKQWMMTALLMIAVLFGAVACDDVSGVVDEAREAVEAELPPGAEQTAEAVVEEVVEQVEEAAEGEQVETAHWSYEDPDHWAALEPACGGMAQSPIDVTAPLGSDLQDIVFSYQQSAVKILNNGHTIQVTYDDGSQIDLAGTVYPLNQFHFHAPSEHQVNGTPADAELHLVHQIVVDGTVVSRAVVGVLINAGAHNPAFDSVWANLPATVSEEAQTIDGAFVNADDLLPDIRTYYTYHGSLTTPPCDENVTWLLLTTPIEMSQEQLDAFTAIIEDNNRPVQDLNDRELLQDTTSSGG